MPTYDFKCLTCHGKLVVKVKMGDEPKPKCPNCAGEMRKEYSAPSIQFKGPGFYSTEGKQ